MFFIRIYSHILRAPLVGLACLMSFYPTLPLGAVELEGYSEPFDVRAVAADASGVVEEVFVREGEAVQAGQSLVRLNSDVHQSLVAIAEQSMNAVGRLDAAKAELLTRQAKLKTLQELRINGHAQQEEVDRAANESAIAEANVLAAEEERLLKRLEYEKLRIELDRRTVRAPISGFVTIVHKRGGEYVAPNSPDVATIAQVDQLLAVFTLLGPQAASFKLSQSVKVRFLDSNVRATGKVEIISPINDAESGTAVLKIRVDNTAGKMRAGERCSIQIGS